MKQGDPCDHTRLAVRESKSTTCLGSSHRRSATDFRREVEIVIIVQLFAAKEPLRFSELGRRVEGVNQKMLTQQLKELEKDGIVTRQVYPQVPLRVEYQLSEMGLALGPAIEYLIDWTLMRRNSSTVPPLI